MAAQEKRDWWGGGRSLVFEPMPFDQIVKLVNPRGEGREAARREEE